MEGMGFEGLVEELREAELDEESEEQREVVDAFMGQLQRGIHGGAPTKPGERLGCNAATWSARSG
jgi:hypothetical protein